MCPSHLRSLLRLTSRRPKARQEATTLLRRGAGIIDPVAWDKAWREAMPADSFNATTYNKETP